jgi:hypothetical protein
MEGAPLAHLALDPDASPVGQGDFPASSPGRGHCPRSPRRERGPTGGSDRRAAHGPSRRSPDPVGHRHADLLLDPRLDPHERRSSARRLTSSWLRVTAKGVRSSCEALATTRKRGDTASCRSISSRRWRCCSSPSRTVNATPSPVDAAASRSGPPPAPFCPRSAPRGGPPALGRREPALQPASPARSQLDLSTGCRHRPRRAVHPQVSDVASDRSPRPWQSASGRGSIAPDAAGLGRVRRVSLTSASTT